MEANKILNADILDILFEGRNKSYGAYQLRKTYNSRMLKALIVTGALLLIIVGGSFIVNAMNSHNAKDDLNVLDTQMAEVKKDEPPPPEIKQIQFTPPKIVKDEEVKKDEKIQEIKDDAVISTKTVESDNTNQVVQAPVEDKGTNITTTPVKVDEDQIFTKVEKEAEYPGGLAAFRKYLEKNLDAQTPTDHNAPPGTYNVIVRFIVSRDGTVSGVTPETSFGYGMEDEAVRVIKKSLKWTPALQNGANVNAYHRQPITFIVTGD